MAVRLFRNAGGRPRRPHAKFGLMHLLACFTLFDGEPQLVNSILDGFLAVTAEQVQTAARKFLLPQNRPSSSANLPQDCRGGGVMASLAQRPIVDVPLLPPNAKLLAKRTKASLPMDSNLFCWNRTPFPDFMVNCISAPAMPLRPLAASRWPKWPLPWCAPVLRNIPAAKLKSFFAAGR